MSAQKPQRKRTPALWVLIPALGGGLYFGSDDVRNTIERWESGNRRVLVVYADKLAGGLPTVCNGLTRHVTTTPIIVGDRWTDEKCEAHEAAVTHTIQRELTQCFTRLPPQKVFDGASSFAWNVGVRAVCRSQSMKLWNGGQWSLGCTRIAYTPSYRPNWSNAGGVFYPGLHNRRKDEMALCMQWVKA